MTTLARIEANRRNAILSTGPRTAEGKATVARNAIRHGIFAATPVIPGETAESWEAHRAGVVESLGPVGLLELNLAERAALLLWRLHRLARYEDGAITAGIEAAEVPPLPPPEEEDHFLDPPEELTRDDQLRDIRRDLQAARRELAGVAPARDYLRSVREQATNTAVLSAVAESVLEAARGCAQVAEGLRADPPAVGKPLLRKLGLDASEPKGVTWTPDLIGRGIALYAGFTEHSPEQFLEAVRAEVEERAEELERKVRRLEREAAAVARLLDHSAGARADHLLPAGGTTGSPSTSGTCTTCSPRRSTNWSGSRPGARATPWHPRRSRT